MIKLFKAERMRCTAFDHKAAVKHLENEYKISIVPDHKDCEIILAERIEALKYYIKTYGKSKKYLIWTREPRYNTCLDSPKKSFFWQPEIHVMNVYTGDVFCDNYYENSYRLVIDRFLEPLDGSRSSDFRTRKIVFLATNKRGNTVLRRGGRDLDLLRLRKQIALRGHQLEKVDIYGRGWPDGISKEDSRGQNRVSRKEEILRSYHFNLCFENTNFPNYCTEKIWESIKFGCLPIYYGEGNNIYKDFPENSFLDYAKIDSADLLFEYVDMMSIGEFVQRMNKCIETFNRAYEKIAQYSSMSKVINPGMLERIAHKTISILA